MNLLLEVQGPRLVDQNSDAALNANYECATWDPPMCSLKRQLFLLSPKLICVVSLVKNFSLQFFRKLYHTGITTQMNTTTEVHSLVSSVQYLMGEVTVVWIAYETWRLCAPLDSIRRGCVFVGEELPTFHDPLILWAQSNDFQRLYWLLMSDKKWRFIPRITKIKDQRTPSSPGKMKKGHPG